MRKIALLFVCFCLFLLTGCHIETKNKDDKENIFDTNIDRTIVVEGEQGQSIIFQLNDSKAAKSLYDQLPLSKQVENFNNDEKIFYPDEPLDIIDAPNAKGPVGVLAYYEPWGDVVMFYGTCNGANGLYGLGEVASGSEQIETLSGNIKIVKGMDESNPNKKSNTSQEAKPQDTRKDFERVNDKISEEDNTMRPIIVHVGGSSFSASLYDNETTQAFLKQMPITLSMEDLHRNEKYYYFSNALPTTKQSVTQIHTGDIKLFNDDCLVLFYEDVSSSYTYTSLGQIDDPQGWQEALGMGSVSVRFENIL